MPAIDKGHMQASIDATVIANVPASIEDQHQRNGDQQLQCAERLVEAKQQVQIGLHETTVGLPW